MKTIDPELLRLREALWEVHPAITCSAVVDTPPAMRVFTLVKKCGRRSRGSLAFWAHPLSGKTSCIRLLVEKLGQGPRPVSIFLYECNYKDPSRHVLAEGAFLEDLLKTIDTEIHVDRSLAGKRNQVKKYLYSLAASTGKLYIVIDEAQGLTPAELCWLKTIINWLATLRISVTTVLFGQQELLALIDTLMAEARSDLQHRFIEHCYELETISLAELPAVLDAYDAASAYPSGRGWNYTQFLWPCAYEAGFRLKKEAGAMWEALSRLAHRNRRVKTVGMDSIAKTLSALADATKDRDGANFRLTPDDWDTAVRESGYPDDVLPRKTRGGDKGKKEKS